MKRNLQQKKIKNRIFSLQQNCSCKIKLNINTIKDPKLVKSNTKIESKDENIMFLSEGRGQS
jgi:hypothetical protein